MSADTLAMITREQVKSYKLALDEVNTSALGDLREIIDGLVGVDSDTAKSVLFDTIPFIMDPYALTASDISATFYEETREMVGGRKPFTPTALAEPVPIESWHALVGFGTSAETFDTEGAEAAYSRLSGGLVRRLTGVASDTAYSNALLDPDVVRYQRVPAPGCCGFCGMLASRTNYQTRESAGVVTGRGLPVASNFKADGSRKSGGQARGVKTRGKRAPGEDFHDHCKCTVIAVHSGNEVEMNADIDKYYEAYRDARSKIDDGLVLDSVEHYNDDGKSIGRTYYWKDADGKLYSDAEYRRMLVRAMDKDAGVMDAIAAEAYPNRPPAHAELFEAATPKPSQGPMLTYENVKDLTDDELAEAMGTVFADDPEAWEKLARIMEQREAAEAATETFTDPFGTVLGGPADTNPDTNPAFRPGRKLTPNEQVAEEYWEYANAQYMNAMDDLNGVFFNRKYLALAREKGISEDQLFSGPFHVANKYASDELKEWWQANGRNTLTSYRYKRLGRPSDRKAWESVKKKGLDNAGINEARRENRRGL